MIFGGAWIFLHEVIIVQQVIVDKLFSFKILQKAILMLKSVFFLKLHNLVINHTESL